MNKLLGVIVLSLVIFAAGCVENKKGDVVTNTEGPLLKATPDLECKGLCKQNKIYYGENFSNGPCLSNEIKPDWVCDVAHNPRQPIDDLPENQCSAYIEGKAKHFVEVTETCELIKAV